MSDDPKLNYWVSWYSELPLNEFELHSPWWISGYTADDTPILCAAIQARREDDAKDYVLQSYDTPPSTVEWRFITEQPDDWVPFSGRFPKAEWMTWPPEPNADDMARRLEKAIAKAVPPLPAVEGN